jgi:hypothetical protein
MIKKTRIHRQVLLIIKGLATAEKMSVLENPAKVKEYHESEKGASSEVGGHDFETPTGWHIAISVEVKKLLVRSRRILLVYQPF